MAATSPAPSSDSPPDPPGPLNPANRLGLDYRALARRFGYAGPIWDVHTHINSLEAARLYMEVAGLFGVERVWSMTPLELVDPLRDQIGDRIHFIAVPDWRKRDEPETFTGDFVRRIEQYRAKGAGLAKFWAAPRGRDFTDFLRLDHPSRREILRQVRDLGMMLMVHVADPDTWFATKYADAGKYGTKAQQYEPLHRLLEEFGDVPFLAAHMAGHPEDLDHLQALVDRHPNLYLDTSATKWMVRELSRQPDRFRAFCRRNRGRVLFGTDIVAGPGPEMIDFDLYASRFWALRTLLETDYDGPSPIVDPDLHLVDATVPADSTARLRGAALDRQTLQDVYHNAARELLGRRGH